MMSQQAVTYDLRADLRKTLTAVIFMSAILLMAGAAYFIGFGQMRYSAVVPAEPIQFFPFWQFFITGFLPVVAYVFNVYLLFTTALRTKRPARFLPNAIALLDVIAVAWGIIFVIWQATVWANCNDGGNTLIPAHPECINRKYPQDQSADWTFIIQVIAGGILCVPSLIGFWLTQQIINTELAAYNLAIGTPDTIVGRYDKPNHRHVDAHYSHHTTERRAANGQFIKSDIGYHLTANAGQV